MRRLRYAVAMSLDGFIAGPKGEYDWIIMDPEIHFASFYKEFDTVLMGRRTFEVAGQSGGAMPGMQGIVCSRTLRPGDHKSVTITANAAETVSALKAKPGKDIWLFGGGELFRSLLDARLVDTIELVVIPILLSQGIPLLPAGRRSPALRLTESKTLPNGTVGLSYAVGYGAGSSTTKGRKPRRKTASKSVSPAKRSKGLTSDAVEFVSRHFVQWINARPFQPQACILHVSEVPNCYVLPGSCGLQGRAPVRLPQWR